MIATKPEQEQFHGPMGIGRWSVYINDGFWKPRNFDVLIIELLQYALQGRVSKILLGVPSRHGKSTLISKNFASYFLAHFPNDKIILSSYSQGLASEFGGQVKNVINHYGYLSPYNVKLATDSKAKNKFNIDHPYRGQMLAVGAGGAILGFGAGLFIVDDPIKNIADAESKVLQPKLRDWFESTAKSRLEKRSNGLPPIMIVIAQRLHLNDLHGIIRKIEPTITANEAFTILRNGGSIDPNVWVDLNIPAICTNPETDLLGRKLNDVLWDEQRDYNWLMAEKKSMGSYLFNAIYQGEPQERDGNIFKREWFEDPVTGRLTCTIPAQQVPEDLPELRYWDFGASGDDGDATAGTKTSYDGEYMYVLDIVNGKFTSRDVLKYFMQTAKNDGKACRIKIEQEPGAGSKTLIQKFRQEKELKGYHIRGDKVKTAKNIRSFELEALAEDRKILLVQAPWNQLLVDQLVSFTGKDGGTDDIVDACTGSARHWKRPRRRIRV